MIVMKSARQRITFPCWRIGRSTKNSTPKRHLMYLSQSIPRGSFNLNVSNGSFDIYLQMLIYFYSDRNYVLEGFEASYFMSDCLYDCSDHGSCDNITSTCNCDSGYYGGFHLANETMPCDCLSRDHFLCQMGKVLLSKEEYLQFL